MVGLRKIKGINRAEFAQRFGIDPVEHYASAVSDAVLAGNMEVTDDSMRLTRRRLDFQNEVLLNFMQNSIRNIKIKLLRRRLQKS